MDGQAAAERLQADLQILLQELGQLHERAKQNASQKREQSPGSDGSIVVRGK